MTDNLLLYCAGHEWRSSKVKIDLIEALVESLFGQFVNEALKDTAVVSTGFISQRDLIIDPVTITW